MEVFAAMEYLLDTADTTYRNILAGLSKGQRTVLSTIAIDGHAENVLSQSYISRHYLGAASSVQAAVRSLLAKQLISRDADTYFLDDKFLELWIRRCYGISLEESWGGEGATAVHLRSTCW
jgi:DNA-binding MarR family transcriptional regulator